MGSSMVPAGLGLGGWQFGNTGTGQPDDRASIAVIHAAGDRGVLHLDTAQGYDDGHSEAVIGRALAAVPTPFFVATKSGVLAPGEVPAAVDASLHRLGRAWIDLFYIHWPRKVDMRPMVEALERERTRGRVRLIGVSNFHVPDLESVAQAGRIDAYQLCYNLLWRHPERDVIPYCIEHGITLVTYSSIAQGLLGEGLRGPERFAPGDARRNTLYYQPEVWPHVRRSVEAMQEVARRAGQALSALALRWVLGRPGVVSSLVGTRSLQQLERNVAAAAARNDAAVDRELDALSVEAMRHIPGDGNIFLYTP